MTKHEITFAEKLTKQGREWQLAKTFKLSKTTYRPDFYLPKENLYIELSYDPRNYDHNKEKYKEFKKLYPHFKFIIVDIDFNPCPKAKRRTYGQKICIHCRHDWVALRKNPKTCPRCKRYDWRKKP